MRNLVITMNQAEQYITKIIFRNCIYKYSGQQFEDFFVSIMTQYNHNFQPVKAYGNIGDRKNDGFDKTTGTYYQVFSPEDITKEKTINDCIKKLKEDFEGLYNYWNDICTIKNYFFVINDKYRGIPAPIIEMEQELSKNPLYSDISIAIFSSKDLERIFDKLDILHKQDILGFIPICDDIMPTVEFEALKETIDYLIKAEISDEYKDRLTVPDFYQKIEFNNLSEEINNKLIVASYQEGLLRQYFNSNPGVREILQKKFHAIYEKSKIDIPETMENYSDSRFLYIIECASPRKILAITTSVLILMSYYFASCDIFEEPKQ